jgi:hypothetical protein
MKQHSAGHCATTHAAHVATTLVWQTGPVVTYISLTLWDIPDPANVCPATTFLQNVPGGTHLGQVACRHSAPPGVRASS